LGICSVEGFKSRREYDIEVYTFPEAKKMQG